ncbi:MAG: lytic transglycosylase domain-containing protein [Flammeovirgaceae bacterium]|nr:lytic transglycosylase domain-containing protein [Flammeovirgaceae bacterium]
MKALQNSVILLLFLGLLAYTVFDKIKGKENTQIDSQLRYESEVFNIELPSEFIFCGEKVPLKEPDVSEKLDREIHENVFHYANTNLILKRANRWFPKMEKIFESYGLPEDLKYLVIIESAFSNVVSPVGATGFWQIMETTGKEFGLVINEEIDERYDPIKSTHVACKYFKQAYKKFGSWTLAAASYNLGITGTERRLREQKVNSYYDLDINSETARYVFKAMAFKEIFTNPDKYKFNLKDSQKYKIEATREIQISESIDNLVDFALVQGINYKLLVRHNPWIKGKTLTVDKPVTLKIPLIVPTSVDLTSELGTPDNLGDSLEEEMVGG